MPRDLERELLEQGSSWPAAWNPEPGEILVGTVILYDQGHTQYGPVRTAILEREDGSRVSLWLNSTVLLSLFQRERPLVGERLGIRYLGKHATKGYRLYRLLVDREPAEVEFAPLGGESDDEPAAQGALFGAPGRARDDAPEAYGDPFPEPEEDDGAALPYASTVVKGGPQWPMRN